MTKAATRFVLAVDPGGMNVGVVLCSLADGVLSPVDGVSIKRTDAEDDTRHTGGPVYARRVIQILFEMLDKHGVADDDLLVAVETVVVPKPYDPRRVAAAKPKPGSRGKFTPRGIWQPLLGTSVILGAVAAVWPKAVLVAPDSADEKVFYPAPLWRLHPKGWVGAGDDGGDERKHQRSAWSIAVDALRGSGAAFTAAVVSSPGRAQRSATLIAGSTGVTFREAPDSVPPAVVEPSNSSAPVGVDPGNLDRVMAALRERIGSEKSTLVLLAEVTSATCPEVTGEALVELALAAGQAVKPTKNPATLRANLAELLTVGPTGLELAG